MKKVKKRVLILCVLMLIASIIFPVSAMAANSFSTTVGFSRQFDGQTRHFTGHNLGISGAFTANPTTGRFTVEPRTGVVFGGQGSRELNRSGWAVERWLNVGAGNYFFRFNKAVDGVWVSSNSVLLSSW